MKYVIKNLLSIVKEKGIVKLKNTCTNSKEMPEAFKILLKYNLDDIKLYLNENKEIILVSNEYKVTTFYF